MRSYRVDVAFGVEASSPAMAIRKLLNAISLTLGEDYMEAMHRSVGIDHTDTRKEIPVDTSISSDDPRFIAGTYYGASNVALAEDEGSYDDVAF